MKNFKRKFQISTHLKPNSNTIEPTPNQKLHPTANRYQTPNLKSGPPPQRSKKDTPRSRRTPPDDPGVSPMAHGANLSDLLPSGRQNKHRPGWKGRKEGEKLIRIKRAYLEFVERSFSRSRNVLISVVCGAVYCEDWPWPALNLSSVRWFRFERIRLIKFEGWEWVRFVVLSMSRVMGGCDSVVSWSNDAWMGFVCDFEEVWKSFVRGWNGYFRVFRRIVTFIFEKYEVLF